VVGLAIVTYAAIAPGKTPEQLSWFVDDVVKRALQGLRGVGRVERIGGVEREILVALDPDRLQALGLTAAGISRALRSNNVDLAGGRAEIGARDQSIRTLAGAKSLDALAGIMIALPTGGQIRLGDLGVVTDTVAEPQTFASDTRIRTASGSTSGIGSSRISNGLPGPKKTAALPLLIAWLLSSSEELASHGGLSSHCPCRPRTRRGGRGPRAPRTCPR
jgi:hypothetical protein